MYISVLNKLFLQVNDVTKNNSFFDIKNGVYGFTLHQCRGDFVEYKGGYMSWPDNRVYIQMLNDILKQLHWSHDVLIL